jgi:hypothetical protein
MTNFQGKPAERPGAQVLRGVLRLQSHNTAELSTELSKWLNAQQVDGFIRHLVVSPSVHFDSGWPKGRAYRVYAVVWPWPERSKD